MVQTAVLAGHGPGFCESFARELANAGYAVALIARSESYLNEFADELTADGHTALPVATDITDESNVAAAFSSIRDELGTVNVFAHTASTITRSDGELDPDRFEHLWQLYTHAALLGFRESLEDLLETNGTVLFFGAARDAGDFAFKSGKDATRGLAKRLLEMYGPDGIQVTHVVINGRILNPDVYDRYDPVNEAEFIDPDALAETCLHLVEQPARARSFEIDVHAAAHTPPL